MGSLTVVAGLVIGVALLVCFVRLLSSVGDGGGKADRTAMRTPARDGFTERERLAVVVEDPDDLPFQYRTGQEEAVAALRVYGADTRLDARSHLMPDEIDRIGAAEELVEETLACISGYTWIDEARGRVLHAELVQLRPSIFNPALVRVFLRTFGHGRFPRRVVYLGVKVGMQHSEEHLAEMLFSCPEQGTAKRMAETFLNCGHSELAHYGREWARLNHYDITARSSAEPTFWGQA
ncbi:hypothetical protein [Streptomyces sp. NPDC101181]|uniref:hypothetical protein n=1 Tax=Streptomyces sp. NPDC101181 TaxID=3366125 RepID=UPI00380C71CF